MPDFGTQTDSFSGQRVDDISDVSLSAVGNTIDKVYGELKKLHDHVGLPGPFSMKLERRAMIKPEAQARIEMPPKSLANLDIAAQTLLWYWAMKELMREIKDRREQIGDIKQEIRELEVQVELFEDWSWVVEKLGREFKERRRKEKE